MGQILLYGDQETDLSNATPDGDKLWIPLEDLEQATGWTAKPEGLCQGDVCVPILATQRADWIDNGRGRLDFAAFAHHLGHEIARDEAHQVWALGPPAQQGVAEGDGPVIAPDFRLPDLDGRPHALSEYRGKKVLLYAWASW